MALEVNEELVVELDDQDLKLSPRPGVFVVFWWTLGESTLILMPSCFEFSQCTEFGESWKELVKERGSVNLVLLVDEALVDRFTSGVVCGSGVCVVLEVYVNGEWTVWLTERDCGLNNGVGQYKVDLVSGRVDWISILSLSDNVLLCGVIVGWYQLSVVVVGRNDCLCVEIEAAYEVVVWLDGGCCLDEVSLESSVCFGRCELGRGMSVEQSEMFGVVYKCGDVYASGDEWVWLRGVGHSVVCGVRGVGSCGGAMWWCEPFNVVLRTSTPSMCVGV
eukprot:6470880-Amphidinium_carterae.4